MLLGWWLSANMRLHSPRNRLVRVLRRGMPVGTGIEQFQSAIGWRRGGLPDRHPNDLSANRWFVRRSAFASWAMGRGVDIGGRTIQHSPRRPCDRRIEFDGDGDAAGQPVTGADARVGGCTHRHHDGQSGAAARCEPDPTPAWGPVRAGNGEADGADPGNCRNRDARAWLPGTTGNSVIDGAVVKRVEGRRGSDPSESHGNQVGWWCGVETGIQEECHVDHRMGVWRASGDRRAGVGTPSCLASALSNVTCAKCRQVRRVGHAPDSGLAGRRSASSKWVRGRDGHLDRP